MYGNEEIIVRVQADGRHYTYWTRPIKNEVNNNLSIPDQATANNTTSASTLATAIQNALPTLES